MEDEDNGEIGEEEKYGRKDQEATSPKSDFDTGKAFGEPNALLIIKCFYYFVQSLKALTAASGFSTTTKQIQSPLVAILEVST